LQSLEETKDQPTMESEMERLTQRTKEFNQSLRENPKDVQKWLDFVKFQDEFHRVLPRQQKSIGATTEKKLSIFEKGLEANPNNEQLLLGYLSYGQLIWEYPFHIFIDHIPNHMICNMVQCKFKLNVYFIFIFSLINSTLKFGTSFKGMESCD
jgi:hypothetical protein